MHDSPKGGYRASCQTSILGKLGAPAPKRQCRVKEKEYLNETQQKLYLQLLLNLVEILVNRKMHDSSMMCDSRLSCIGKATLN